LTIWSTSNISARFKLINLNPDPSESTVLVKLNVVSVLVFADVCVLLTNDDNSTLEELAIVATSAAVPKFAVPPVPPPDKVIVGDAADTSLSAFAKTKSLVWVYISPGAVNPVSVTIPEPLADKLENFLWDVYV